MHRTVGRCQLYFKSGRGDSIDDGIWVFYSMCYVVQSRSLSCPMMTVQSTTGKLGFQGPLPEGNCCSLSRSDPGAQMLLLCGQSHKGRVYLTIVRYIVAR